MNHFPNRAISLILAVVFLFSAAGLSFAILFKGTPIFADTTTGASFGVKFYSGDKDQNRLTVLKPNTEVTKIVITVTDHNLSASTYNTGITASSSTPSVSSDASSVASSDAPESSSSAPSSPEPWGNYTLELNTDNFMPLEGSWDSSYYSFEKATPLYDFTAKGCRYVIVIEKNMKFTGLSNLMTLSVNLEGLADNEYTRDIESELKGLNTSIPEPNNSYRPDRNDDDDDSSSSHPDIAPPTPTVIVSAFDYGGQSVTAAGNFSLKLTLSNTSKKLPIDNIVMKVTVPEAFTMNGSSNTFYIERLNKNETVERTLDLSVKPNAEPISHAIKINFTYEAVIDEVRKPYTADQEISIPVGQLDRFAMNSMDVPAEIYVGEDASISANFINKGKTVVYNVSAEIAGNIAQPGQQQFIGNIDGGKEDSADFLIGALEGGPVTGEVIITYEDANMNVRELRAPFNINAIQPDMGAGMEEMAINPEDEMPSDLVWYLKVPVWGWMVGGVVLIIFVAFTIKAIRAHRQRKLEEKQDEDF